MGCGPRLPFSEGLLHLLPEEFWLMAWPCPDFHRTQLVGEAALEGDDGRDGVDASFFGFALAFSTGTGADWQGSMDFHGFPWISCKYSHLVGLSNILIHVFSQSHKTSNLCLAKCTYIVLNQPWKSRVCLWVQVPKMESRYGLVIIHVSNVFAGNTLATDWTTRINLEQPSQTSYKALAPWPLIDEGFH